MSGFRLTFRALQLILSLTALATTAKGFRAAGVADDVPDFTILMQTVLLYSLLLLVGVRPQLWAERSADVIMFALTLAAGVVLLNSSYKSNSCGDNYSYYYYEGCGKLTAGVWCTFLSMVMFVVTFFMTLVSGKSSSDAEAVPQGQYVAQTTPRNNNLTPNV